METDSRLFIRTRSIPWPFFPYGKDWSRVGVATLEKIGQDWGKRLEKGLAEDWMFFFSIFLARSSFVFTIASLSPTQEDGRGAASRAGPPFGEEETIWLSTWNHRGNG
jgi:hypothetical protein